MVLPSGGKINKKATRGMSAAEVERLRDLLSRLITNLHD
jgi:hypothetical protein